jgi:hypothetical protein
MRKFATGVMRCGDYGLAEHGKLMPSDRPCRGRKEMTPGLPLAFHFNILEAEA